MELIWPADKPFALRLCRAMVWHKAQIPVFSREESIVFWRTVTMACIPLQCLSLTTNLMAFHMVTLFLCVQCFAANAENDTAISWNLSALSIGNDLDLLPADSDIPEEITFCTCQRFARHWWWSFTCQTSPFFLTLPNKGTGLFVLISSRKSACGFCL